MTASTDKTSREGRPDMVNTINPADCKPGEVYKGTVNGKLLVLLRRSDEDSYPWESFSALHDHADVSDLVRLVPADPADHLMHEVNNPDLEKVALDEARIKANIERNEARRETDRWRRAHEIVEGERDQARESLRRLRDETDFDLFTVRDQLKQCRGEREQMMRERDEVRADRDYYADSLGATVTERAEWKARAEALEAEAEEAFEQGATWQKARTAPAVTKAEVGKVVREALVLHGVAPERVTDAAWSLLSGPDPAVFVVRESDVAAVEVQPINGGKGWLADGALVNMCESPTESEAQEAVDHAFALLVGALAAARAIEAEQATDPVEELAWQIESATRKAIRQVCVDLAAVAPSLDPLAVERAMEVTAASRKVAAHVLGQEASDGR